MSIDRQKITKPIEKWLKNLVQATKKFSEGEKETVESKAHPFKTPKEPVISKMVKSGLLILIVFAGGFLIWSTLSPLESAAIAPGKVTVGTNRKTIQHLEGGIVQKIYVREGEVVKMGQSLILLDETQSKAQLGIVNKQMYALLALEARLETERDSKKKITFPKTLLNKADNPEVKKIIKGQKNIFETRLDSLSKNIELLLQQIGQLKQEANSLEEESKTFDRQISHIEEQLVAVRKLEKKKYIERTHLLKLEREKADIEGERANSVAQISRAKQRINDARLKIVNLKQERQKEIVEQLQETQEKLAELEEKGISAKDILKRTLIRAPRAGRIVDLKIHTKGAVITPGEEIMDIVPTDDPLIVEARVKPTDIDIVHAGLVAKVKLTALKQRHTPALTAIVNDVSADSFEDNRTGEFYYKARIKIPPEQLKRLNGVELYPGMPVEVMIIIDRRTPWEYFITPIEDSFNRAFRED